ncbi:hypothetical protein [Pelagibacter phage HTVC010P]|uniref:tail fiber assembly n=1 Tax=Pelagibacter phage HTVC010P TaxID=1283077 RepID=UPI0002B27178|nr:tail fiber assembly [Pelagibacter phage HTVC010P]AGE60303.1 hypothetical protein [Pelagibacter phage HTVC010P]
MARHHNINGNIVPFTAEEEAARDAEEQAYSDGAFDRAMADLRQRRNRLLAECDWVMVSDSPIADKTDWQTYRTNLRNITNGLTTVEEVNAVVFPTKP